MLIHFCSLNNFTLQELDDFLDVPLADEVSEEVKNLLVDLK